MSKQPINRRNFIGTGLAAAAATLGTGKAVAGEGAAPEASAKKRDENPYNPRTHQAMPTRAFGKTGFKVGILSLGGQATIETPGKEAESEAIINRALDLGINYIDTARYGQGLSQKNIGRAVKHRRKEVWLSTKTADRSYDGSMRLLEESLESLQTDHLDLWQLHNIQTQAQVDAVFSKDGALKALQRAQAEGMVRYLGITGHYEPLVLKRAIEAFPFDAILMALNAADPHYLSFKDHLLPEAQKRGMAIIGMKVATRGRMLSSWSPPPLDQQPARMATPLAGTLSIKEALTYNMSLPVSTTIIGIDNLDQLEEDVAIAADFSPLAPEEMVAIEYKTLPIVRQGLYFRRWDLGA